MNDAVLEEHYQCLWRNAIESFKSGRVEIDANLLSKRGDLRRGMTLVIRPHQRVVRQISLLLSELAAVEPNQYFYGSSEFHITLLSLFTATENYQPYYDKQSSYLRAVDKVLSQARPFTIRFDGITASPGAIMVQGFPEDDALNQLRDCLRRELINEQLGGGLDRRYKIKTAHITVFRFQSQPKDTKQFLRILNKFRLYDFGTIKVESIQMVKNDWYMSEKEVNVVEEWELT